MTVLELPPSVSCSSLVSLPFLYGTWRSPCTSAYMTSDKGLNMRPILVASLIWTPWNDFDQWSQSRDLSMYDNDGQRWGVANVKLLSPLSLKLHLSRLLRWPTNIINQEHKRNIYREPPITSVLQQTTTFILRSHLTCATFLATFSLPANSTRFNFPTQMWLTLLTSIW